jgi:hypothetical protein
MDLLKFIRQKMGNFLLFLRLFSRIFRCSGDFLAKFRKHISCWHTYFAVGVPANAIAVVG